jgi:arylformamidase
MSDSKNGGLLWIDVTRPVTAGMVHWPGDPDVAIDKVADMARGDVCNVTRMSLCVHAGTHMDAPAHFLRDGAGMETVPLDVLMGPVRVIPIEDPVSIRRAELEKHHIQAGERVILRTSNISIPFNSEFRMDFVYIAEDAAKYLAEKKVSMVGVDYMSVGGFYQDMVETHVALLKAGIWIVENLDLTEVEPGDWEIICLPMKLVGSDGAPARVLMRRVAP